MELSKSISLMARKPFSLQDLQIQIERHITPEEIAEMTGNQKILQDRLECWSDLCNADLSRSQWWKIVLDQEQVEILVDTQGYEYLRYAGVLKRIYTAASSREHG